MITVQELMSDTLYTLSAHDTIHTARELMLQKRIRHVPIVDEVGNLVGLLTKHDVLSVSISTLAEVENEVRDELEEGIPISEVMITDLMVGYLTTHLREAARFMLEQKHGCLPILSSDQKLAGILTEADFVRLTLYLMEKLGE
ncbi:MAG: CBS domain-containing protein [Thiotrichaceae bacterium]